MVFFGVGGSSSSYHLIDKHITGLDYNICGKSCQGAHLIVSTMRRTIHPKKKNMNLSRRIRERLFFLQLEQVRAVHHFLLPQLIFRSRVSREPFSVQSTCKLGASPMGPVLRSEQMSTVQSCAAFGQRQRVSLLQRSWMIHKPSLPPPERRTSSVLPIVHHDLHDEHRPFYHSTPTAGSLGCRTPKGPTNNV